MPRRPAPRAVRARPSLAIRLRKSLPAILIALVATYALNRTGTLRGIEHMILDAEMRMSAKSMPDSEVIIVQIPDADYTGLFEGRSPLLVPVLQDLVRDIAHSRPAVIGIDIDTSHPQFRDFRLDPTWTPIIWERDAFIPLNAQPSAIEPLDVLGGQDPALNDHSGIPALLDDPHDKVTRAYSRCVETKAGRLPSFAIAVVTAYASARQGASPPPTVDCDADPVAATEPMLIRFFPHGSRTTFSASEIKRLSAPLSEGGQAQRVADLADKIVLLGGSYGDHDRHETPIGTLVGVEVLANVIDTLQRTTAVRLPPAWQLFLVDFVAAVVLVLAFHALETSVRTLLLVGLLVAGTLSVISSAAAFHSLSRIALFAPTLLAVAFFEVYVRLRERAVLRATQMDQSDRHSASSR